MSTYEFIFTTKFCSPVDNDSAYILSTDAFLLPYV